MKAREIEKLLQAEGCTFVRHGANHAIWQKGKERFIVPYGTRNHAHSIVAKMLKRARTASVAREAA